MVIELHIPEGGDQDNEACASSLFNSERIKANEDFITTDYRIHFSKPNA